MTPEEAISVSRYPTISEIQRVTAERFGIPLIDMSSQRRSRDLARARQAAMYLARVLTLHTLKTIGTHFGNRDHTTVVHAVRLVEKLASEDADFGERVTSLKKQLDSS